MGFIYSLANALISQPWTSEQVRAQLKPSSLEPPLRIPGLADRILIAFKETPEFDSLKDFLKADAGLARALGRTITPLRFKRLSPKKPGPSPRPAWLGTLKLPDLPTEAALSEWLETDPHHLRWRADITGRNRKHPNGPLRQYRYRWIARKNGPPRLLEIPKSDLKRMQRKILAEILDVVPAHRAAHGFRIERSIITNASVHCGKQSVLRFDLADFFPSITAARVFRIFRSIGFGEDVSRLLMGICTTSLPANVWESRPGARLGADFLARQQLITRHLPQGAPTSPALANLAAHRLDRRLSALAARLNAGYTRYADDLTFSGDDHLARSCKRLATLVAVIAADEGFSLNHRKTRLMRKSVRQHVTGVVVNVRPNIPRAEFDRLKAILTNCIRHGTATQNRDNRPDFRAHLAGKLSHVQAVHPLRGQKLWNLFEQINWAGRE